MKTKCNKLRLIIATIFTLLSSAAAHGYTIDITSTNFPDAIFRNWLLEQDYGKDGKLTEDEIKNVTSIYVFYKNISSLKGIEYFTSLTTLWCHFNQLTSLDVSKNTALTHLECGCNQLTSLDVSKNTALTSFGCDNNKLTSLDVSKNTALTDLRCYNNQLTSLDVSKNTALTDLNCESNHLTSLVVSKNTELTRLYCSSNQLTSLDVSKNTALTTLYCSRNQIKGASMDAFIQSLPTTSTNPKFGIIENSDDEGNECTKSQVAAAKAKGWTPLYYNGSEWVEYKGSENTVVTKGINITSTNFPDANFRNWLLEQDYGKDGKLTEDEIKNVTSISVGNKNISSLQGIEYFTSLTSLYCESNQLTSLDVSKNTALTSLFCYSNQLTSLDVSKNTALTYYLWCNGNKLTSIDVSKNTALTDLNCSYNQLTSLDVSKNTALRYLNCGSNQLTSLDVSKNTALTRLSCYQNQIKGASMDALIQSLPTTSTNPTFRLIANSEGDEGNECTKSQVAAAKAKGWSPLYYNGSKWVEYEGSENTIVTKGIDITSTNFPDANFRNWLLEQDYGKDGKLTEDEINNVTSIEVFNRNIYSLKGIEYFTSLTSLSCLFNHLTSLDVSKNTALTRLYCYRNQLTSLDVSKNTALTDLNCSYNQLTSLDVSKNTALTDLNCSYNQLTSLDVSKNTALTDLYCNGNKLTSIDVSKNATLTYLDCGGNQLTSLEVSKNTALTDLNCESNHLTSLVVSKNTALRDLRCDSNQLTSLDVSKNTALTVLWCASNQLTSLDVSKNTALTVLWCSLNQLTSLDVSKNTALKSLYCYSNQLTSLDVSKNTALKSLYCYSNQLTSLDVSKNTALTDLFCSRNQIRGASMDALIQSLPTTSTNLRFGIIDNSEGDEGNECTKSQVAAAKAKGWTPLYYNGSEWVEYEGSEDAMPVADIRFVSVTCDNTNTDALTKNDKLTFHATFTNYGDQDEIATAVMICDKEVSKIIARSDYKWMTVGNNENVTIDYEYALDTIPNGEYTATVMHYDWNRESWIYNSDYMTDITIVDASSLFAQGDVNMDNAVNGTDLVALSNIVLGRKEKTESADVNGDGSVNGTDIVALSNIILGRSSNAPRRAGETGAGLSIEPFSIQAGEEKEMLIDLTNPNDELTLVQFDLHLPEGLSIKKNGADLDFDMADRTSWRKHTLDASETDGGYRFLLYSSSNTVIDGTSGAIIKVNVVADASFKGGKIVIDNTLLVSPDEKETKPEAYEYTFPTADDGSAKLAIEPFDIKAGEEKEMLIDLSNPNDEVTLVQFDLQLPEGLTVKKSGADLVYDMADRTSWRKHTLDANETDDGYRFLLYSSSNTVIDGTEGTIIKVTLAASQDMTGKTIALDNILLVSPDEKETKPARYEYVIGSDTGIRAITIDNDANAPIYNLRGQRLSAPQKGINIIGGKKVVVK